MKKGTKIVVGVILLAIAAVGIWSFAPAFIDKNIEEQLPEGFEFSEPATTSTQTESGAETTGETSMQKQETNTPTIISSGEFKSSHDVTTSGQARILSNGEKNILQINNLQTSNGPDLFIYLSEKSEINSEEDVKGALRLTKLKGNSGNQVYEIPDDIDITQYNSLAIHCRAYNHLFGSVSLK